ncbi:PAAR domain-containing protein [Luteimonas qiangzhengi]|uniref:PAAR domain-containing protein n=1 Tax=Luteimonas sp. MJ146 TaxID=3129240 RepID=UPI0031BA1E8C
MARNWIVVGDPTSSGGSVITGSSFTDIDGIPVARVNDQATCPRHKGAYPIVDGDSTLVVDGQPVALHGSSLACGCKVLSAQQVRVFVDVGGGGGSGIGGGTRAAIAGAAAAAVAAAKSMVDEPIEEEAGEYDEALRFCSEAGEPLVGIRYTLKFASGDSCSGITGDDGLTERICTCDCEQIVSAVLSPRDGGQRPCCTLQGGSAQDELVIELEGVSTSEAGFGTSVVEVQATGHERDLTVGELAIARRVFADSVDYSKVKIHNHGYWMFFGLQDKYTAVTPNGQMYFPNQIYKDDFSLRPGDAALFVHEMTHVWQRQLGYAVKWNGLFVSSRGPDAYMYNLKADTPLSEYNMEQQADIISDYYMIILRGDIENARGSRGAPGQLKAALAGFLRDPSSTTNLPGGR